MDQKTYHIGFVSTRFHGTDGVSLETEKWAHVLERMGHPLYYFAGECDRPEEISYVVPEAYFRHPEIDWITQRAFGVYHRDPEVTRRIYKLKDYLKEHLLRFIQKFHLELLIIENALTIPLNIPLGIALAEIIAETGIDTLAHHHDFYWERKRFLTNCVRDFLDMAFPPRLPGMRHVVINSVAAAQLAYRRGLSSRIIPNVMDFDTPAPALDAYTTDLRNSLGIAPDEIFLLQPTRIIRRKGIEYAIELAHMLGGKSHLVISHASGDEGDEYARRVRNYATMFGVKTSFISDRVGVQRGMLPDGEKIFTLGDVYPYADLVTYPSLSEGFGNAFLEAIYYRQPLMVNNYTIYATDIKPKGFRAIEFDGFVTQATIDHASRVLLEPEYREEMTAFNYQLARRYYGYTVLEHQLFAILQSFFGDEDQ